VIGVSNPITFRILVVDDYEPWRRSLRSILQKDPSLQVIGEAEHGFDALQKATELKPDLILLDIHLPDIDGIEVSSRIGDLIPDTKILFVSQVKNLDIVKAAMGDGMRGFVWKMDTATELLPAIQTVLRGERFISKGIKAHAL